MLALTYHQPYASLQAFGAKGIETRGWHPQESRADLVYPFRLALHAGKARDPDLEDFYDHELPSLLRLHPDAPGSRGLAMLLDRYPRYELLPFGAIVGGHRVTGVRRTEEIVSSPIPECAPPAMALEAHLGLYAPGRWGWLSEAHAWLPEPISTRGYQRLWWWQTPPDIRSRAIAAPYEAVEAQTAAAAT